MHPSIFGMLYCTNAKYQNYTTGTNDCRELDTVVTLYRSMTAVSSIQL